MITQTPLSVRIDMGTLEDLDNFCYAAAAKRNMVINRAINEYIRLLEIFARCACTGQDYREDKSFINWCEHANRRRNEWWHF